MVSLALFLFSQNTSSSISYVVMLSTLLLILILTTTAQSQGNDWLCESLICDPPKTCKVIDEVPQCYIDNTNSQLVNSVEIPSTEETTEIIRPTASPFTLSPFIQSTNPPHAIPSFPTETQTTKPTDPSPLAPLLNLFGGNAAPGASTLLPPLPFSLPTLPPLPTPAPPTTTPKQDVCTLPPVTGNCNRARIMWYYDYETGRCERFSWSGCGNENRFSSKMQCEQTCSKRYSRN